MGKVTELTKLHQNRLASIDVRGRQLWILFDRCRIIREANSYQENSEEPIVTDIDQTLREILNLLDHESLEPYRYVEYFDLELNNFFEDVEGNIIYPVISEKRRTHFSEWYSANHEKIEQSITVKTLENIQRSYEDKRQCFQSPKQYRKGVSRLA